MARDSIVITLSPSSLRVTTRAGRTEASPLDPSAWESLWAAGFEPLDNQLMDMLRRLDVRAGSGAEVVYHAAHAHADVVTVPVGAKTAVAAARLQLRETLPGGAAGWTTCLRVLATDTDESGGPRTHVLLVADRDDSLEKLGGMLRRCTLRVASLLPAKGAILASAARRAMAMSDDKPAAMLLLADWTTAIAGGSNGKLSFVRATDFGYGLLADAIVRAARANGVESLNSARSYHLLMSAGIPKRGQMIDTETNLKAEAALPLMQSVLQRYVVEVRQTLRFAFDDASRSRATIITCGAGASIPGIEQVLMSQLDLPVERGETSGDAAEGQGELNAAAETADLHLSLLPAGEIAERSRTSLSTSTRMGAVAAALTVGGIAAWAFTSKAAVDGRLSGMNPRIEAMTLHESQRTEAAHLSASIASANATLKDALGARPRWLAVLDELSHVCGEQVRLTEVSAAYSKDLHRPVLTIKGLAMMPADTSPEGGGKAKTDALSELIARLSASRLVEGVELMSSRAGDAASGQARSFDLLVRLASDTVDSRDAHALAGGNP